MLVPAGEKPKWTATASAPTELRHGTHTTIELVTKKELEEPTEYHIDVLHANQPHRLSFWLVPPKVRPVVEMATEQEFQVVTESPTFAKGGQLRLTAPKRAGKRSVFELIKHVRPNKDSTKDLPIYLDRDGRLVIENDLEGDLDINKLSFTPAMVNISIPKAQ